MDGRTAVRLGGIFGLLAVVVMIPAYLVGYPDAPGSPEEATSYFGAGIGTFVFSNGVLPLFHVFFFILFLGVLYGVLRSAEDGAQGGGGGLPAAALAGGIVFAALSAAGFAAEILYPAALQRFGAFEPDAAFVLVSLTLSSWLYHFCQVGASAYGTSHLCGGPGDRCTAEVAGSGGVRGRPPDAFALSRPASGCPGGAVVDSGGLRADAYRRRWVYRRRAAQAYCTAVSPPNRHSPSCREGRYSRKVGFGHWFSETQSRKGSRRAGAVRLRHLSPTFPSRAT